MTEVDTGVLASEIRVVVGQLLRRLREQAHNSDLTHSQTSVLLRLERDGATTATELARAEGIRPQSMAKTIQALEEAGLIGGAPDPGDGRKTLLSLTDAAREQFSTGRRAKEDWLVKQLDATLSPPELRQLADCLELIRRLAQ
ncbi:MarR family transcriptional regulator [Pseudonocardiaceae bacterium YIM PH 21723]|nr:MarR family transcriptional regulator [Pseudonocardiaceae bacterium YIM PH 21723]